MAVTEAADVSNDRSDTPVGEKADLSHVESGHGGVTIDAETNRALLKRIDRRVMPVVRSSNLDLIFTTNGS